MKKLNFALLAGVGVMLYATTSCTQETFDLNPGNTAGTIGLVHAPDFYAWSGKQSLTGKKSRAASEFMGRETPLFTEWCADRTPVIPACPSIPEDAIEVTPQNYYSINFEANHNYVFRGDLEENRALNVTIYFADLPAGSNLFIDGNWWFCDGREHNPSLSPADYPNIYILKDSQFCNETWEEETPTYADLNIYNYGCFELFDFEESIQDGLTIYNTGSLNVENNNEDTKDVIVSQPIYSTGTVRFGGDAYLNADNYYFREVCVDGKLSIKESTKIESGYLNADEIVCEGNSKIEVAPEGLIISGTIAMLDNGLIYSIGSENAYDLGAILANEILGTNKEYTTDHKKSEVDETNFSKFFKNIDIFITQTINNYQDKSVIESYVPDGGKTTALLEAEFDASGDDYFSKNDVNGIVCGGGYKYLPNPKASVDPDPETPENPDPKDPDPKDPTDPTPGEEVVVATNHDNEVEINLSINDAHKNENGELKYGVADLWTKLSIHVRKGTDVEVVMPVPAEFFCESDDFNILQKHEEGLFVSNSDEHTATYTIVNEDKPEQVWTVTLTMELNIDQNYIKVTTNGITQELIDYLMEKNGDGINFEVWNYYTSFDIVDGVVKEREGVNAEALQNYLNQSTVEFLTQYPDYYINAFGVVNDVKTPGDCTVDVIGKQKGEYAAPYEGSHLNASPHNQIYVKKGVTPDNLHQHD